MMPGLDQQASVYTPHATTKAWTVEAKTGLICRLARGAGGSTFQDRADLAMSGTFYWDSTYTMPALAQIEVSLERWNVTRGTERPLRGPSGATLGYAALVVRAP